MINAITVGYEGKTDVNLVSGMNRISLLIMERW